MKQQNALSFAVHTLSTAGLLYLSSVSLSSKLYGCGCILLVLGALNTTLIYHQAHIRFENHKVKKLQKYTRPKIKPSPKRALEV